MNSENNSSFSEIEPRLQLAWDSTSLGTLKECPRKYFYTMVLGRQPRKESVHLIFGQLYHAAIERYDHERSKGASYDDALDAAVQYCFEASGTRNPAGFIPWNSDDPNKNRESLVRTVIWYLEQFQDDAAETIQLANGKPAVELSFRFEAGASASTGEAFWFCGHLDRLVKFNDDIYVLDHKTTKSALTPSYFEGFSPDNQMSLYTMAAQIVYQAPARSVIIDGAQILVTLSRFQRGFTTRTPDQLSEWIGDTMDYLARADEYAARGYWPMNDKSCGNYGGCPFRSICGKAPSVREKWLTNLTQPRRWDPLQVRGDI